MMAGWILTNFLLSLLFLGIAIYQHIAAAALSLPLSPATTIPAILLPALSFFNTLYYYIYSRPSSASTSRPSNLLPESLQLLQVILTTILGTTFFSDTVPSSTRQCLLSTQWQDLWTSHDSAAIRRIQDAYDCCGFNSVRDRAWPFPHKGNPQPDCAAQWGRSVACRQPWEGAMNKGAGLEFGVVVAVGILQLINVLLTRYRRCRSGQADGGHASGSFIAAVSKILGGREEENPDTVSERRRLTGAARVEDVSSPRGSQEHPQPSTRHNPLGNEERSGQGRRVNGYGATGTTHEAPIVEPSVWDDRDDESVA